MTSFNFSFEPLFAKKKIASFRERKKKRCTSDKDMKTRKPYRQEAMLDPTTLEAILLLQLLLLYLNTYDIYSDTLSICKNINPNLSDHHHPLLVVGPNWPFLRKKYIFTFSIKIQIHSTNYNVGSFSCI